MKMHSAQKIEKKNRVFAKSVSSQKCTFFADFRASTMKWGLLCFSSFISLGFFCTCTDSVLLILCIKYLRTIWNNFFCKW